jgi:phosphoribosyl 1,2-cyclic phosphodiesterase
MRSVAAAFKKARCQQTGSAHRRTARRCWHPEGKTASRLLDSAVMALEEERDLVVTFWGVRGSVPSPMGPQEVKAKIVWAIKAALHRDISNEDAAERYVDSLPEHIKGTYGGNTSCVQLQSGNTTIICDAGSGIRGLGMELMKGSFGQGTGTAHLFISHTHWDHIQGFPFFLPAYVPGNRMVVYSPLPDIKNRLETQQGPWYFPISLEAMEADLEFVCLSEGESVRIDDLRISYMRLNHPGGSFGYRFDGQEGALVYATDTALSNLSESEQKAFVAFLSQARIAVLDAQYTSEEAASRHDRGHSSLRKGIDLALLARVKTLVFFHHDPALDDLTLYERFQEACKYLESRRHDRTCFLIMAHAGLQLTV